MKLSLEEFSGDMQGRTYADVIRSTPAALSNILAILSNPDVQRRLEDAERCHERPALAGAVKEIEADREARRVLCAKDPTRANRLRQATGAAVRIIMEGRGWKKTGRKGSVGVGEYFNKAERYECK